MMLSNRQQQLSNLQTYIQNVDKEVTMILQSLHWDRNTILEKFKSVDAFDTNSHVSTKTEMQRLKALGYGADEKLLPEPLDPNANTIIKLRPEDIEQIIETASKNDPQFKKGNGRNAPTPLTLERLQSTYTMDERRAIYDAVVASVPNCHDLSDLALLDNNTVKSENRPKTRTEILSELRDMKRRRTKYRVAAKTQNYSDVLRDVIRTQMELYTDDTTEDPKPDLNSRSKSPSHHNNYHNDNASKERKSTEYQRKRSYDNKDTEMGSLQRRWERSQSKDDFERRKKSKRDDRDSKTEDYRKRHEATYYNNSDYKHEDRSRAKYYERSDDRTLREKSRYAEKETYKERRSEGDKQRRHADKHKHFKKSDEKYSKYHDKEKKCRESEKHGSNSREFHKDKSDRRHKEVRIKQEIDDGSYEDSRDYKSYYAFRDMEVKREKDNG